MSFTRKKFSKNGLLNGFHKIRSKTFNGSGNFRNGKLNGKCVKKWKDGEIHEGVCKNDKLVKGKKIIPYYSKTTKKMQKQIQIGTFKNSKLNGKCVKKWRNAIYRGSCKNGIQRGKGTYIFEGKKYKGIWSGKPGNLKLNGSRKWGRTKN